MAYDQLLDKYLNRMHNMPPTGVCVIVNSLIGTSGGWHGALSTLKTRSPGQLLCYMKSDASNNF